MPEDSLKSGMDSSGSNSKNSATDDFLSTSPGTSSLRERTDSESSDKQTRFVLPSVGGSPPKILTMNEVVNVVNNIQKMEIVHEIALNPEFKLQPYEPPENSLEKRIKDTMHKAFWDILTEQLNRNPPCFDHAIQLLKDIKECFPEIIPKHNQRALDHINEILDTDVIKQQAEQGVLNFKAYAEFIIEIMSKSCAPVRDEQIQKLREIDGVVETFKGILEAMQVMKLDVTNWLLEYAKKDLLANSVEYEKQKFKEYLEYYNYGFPATESWLKRNIKYDSNGIMCATDEIIYNAYMELLDWDNSNDFPEILSIDRERIFKLSNRALRLCLCASTMAICTALPIISQDSENRISLAKQIEILFQNITDSDKIKDTLENVWIQIKSFVSSKLKEKNINLESEIVFEEIFKQLIQLESKDSPVRKLMWERLKVFIRLVLRTKFAQPGPPPGYGDFKDELESIATAFQRVIIYNYSVFRDYYLKTLNDSNVGKNSTTSKNEVVKGE